MAKKIRLLSTYNNLPPNSIITLDDATADKLLAGGVGATTDLTGGVVRYLDSDGSIASGQITAQQRVSISVPAGSVLTLNGGAQAQGTLETIGAGGAVASSRPLRSGTTGPLAGGKTYRVAVDFGTFQTVTQQAEDAYSQAPRFDYPVRLATFGDSLTDTCTADTHDLTVATVALFNDKMLSRHRLASQLLFNSRGRVIPVANCGLGGTTSSEILDRDLAAPGVNRRGLKDAADTGAKVVLISLGRNEALQAIRANTSMADQQALMLATSANVVTAVRRAQSLGMYPILREIAGYFYEAVSYNYAFNAGFTPADVAMQQAYFNRLAVHIANNVVPTLGDMGFLRIREGMVDENGAWLRKYSLDGLHENYNGASVISKRLIDMIDSMTRPAVGSAYAPLPSGAGGVNAFTNAALLPPYNSGRVSGIDFFVDTTGGNNATVVATPPVDGPDGRRWQDFLVTPTGFTGGAKTLAPNGLSSIIFYVRFSMGGATPTLPIAIGDVFRQECDLIIDDGEGGPPSVLNWGATAYMGYSGNNFTHWPMSTGTGNGELLIADEVIDGKIISLPIRSPAASADITSAFISIRPVAGSTKPYRVRIGVPREVKYPVSAA
jgi:hypothetical protein